MAHLYEVQAKYKLAKEHYEALLKEKTLPPHLKADICRQLGNVCFYYSPLPLSIFQQVLTEF